MRYLIGIDEAGRGALAGPVCVGALLMPEDFDWQAVFSLITRRGEPKLRDSKQLSPQQREIAYAYIAEHGALRHAAALVEADVIDSIGIANAAREAAAIALSELVRSQPALKVAGEVRLPEAQGSLTSPSLRVKVLLDAGLSVSGEWEQESFVKGDENIPAIALASIVAKVTRDRHMDELAETHFHYGFEKHKGYGTQEHYRAIHAYGISTLHRRTFVHV